MNQGDTPTITYENLPFDTAQIAAVKVLIYGSTKIEFSGADVVRRTGSLSVTLTQAQTISLDPYTQIQMQIRVRTNDGTAYTSNTMYTTIGEMLKLEVI
ncbi:MAG: hypothetical protein RSB39_05950 [Oscillospiraceae bacterium]